MRPSISITKYPNLLNLYFDYDKEKCNFLIIDEVLNTINNYMKITIDDSSINYTWNSKKISESKISISFYIDHNNLESLNIRFDFSTSFSVDVSNSNLLFLPSTLKESLFLYNNLNLSKSDSYLKNFI